MDLLAVIKRVEHGENFGKRRRLNVDDYLADYENDVGVTCCSVSPQNLVAFSSCGRLEQGGHGANARNLNIIYVCDINTPWDVHVVKSCEASVTVLEWDQSGRNLLIGDSSGVAEMWTSLTHLIDEWTRVAEICIPNEPIQTGTFLYNGKRIMVSNQSYDSTSYTDKYVQTEMQPTVRGFGGRALEGFLVVGMTGLAQAFIMGGTKGKTTNTEVLGGIRLAYQYIDLAWTRDGEILAVACTGNPLDPILYCKLIVQKDKGNSVLDEYQISSEALTGFFPQLSAGKDERMGGVCFSSREDPSGILLVLNTDSGGSLQYMELCEQERPLHTLFTNSSRTTRILQWQCMLVFNTNSRIVCICPTRNVWASASETGVPQHHLVIATAAGDLICLQRENMQQAGQISVLEKAKYDRAPCKAVSAMCYTATGNALVAFDSLATMFICKLSPVTDPGGPMTVPYAVTVFEYCLVSRIDCLDVLIGLRPAMIDTVCEKITENFHQQSPGVQQLFQNQLLALKMAIYRLVPNGSGKASLQYSILMLNSIYSALRSLLRPPPELNLERTPADSLTAVLGSKVLEGVTEIDKVLLHLEVKEFTVEASTLITVQHLIQWTTNFVLKMLSNLPEWRNSPRGSVCDLLRDHKLVNMLRELLVIFRIWGLIRQSCLPAFCYTETIDVIATLFRILTRLLQTPEADDSLLNECCQLSSQLIIPEISLSLPSRGLSSSILFMNPWPLQYHYGVQSEEGGSSKFPDSVTGAHHHHHHHHHNQHGGGGDADLRMDSVRHIYLGSKPHNVRYCSRCQGVSIVKGLARSTAAKAWDMRWQMCCPCRGMWSRQEIRS